MENEKIANREAITFIVTIMINTIVLTASKVIIQDCKSSSLINAIFISSIAIFITFIICKLFKNFAGEDLLDISRFLGGHTLQFIVGIIFITYFTFITSILLRKICDCLQIIYYPMTNLIFILLLFIISAGIISHFRNGSIFKSTLIIFPLLFIAIILIFVGNSKNFTFKNISPVLGNGTNATFITGSTNLFAFTGLSFLYFLPSHLINQDKFKKIAISSVILTSIFLILTIANIVFMFSDTLSSSELFPLYISVRYIEFGTFFQRMDSAFLLICTLSFISHLTLSTNICINIFKKISNLSDSKPIIYPYLLCVFAVALTIKHNTTLQFLENNVFKILFFAITIAFAFIILILANLKKRNQKQNRNQNQNQI